MTQAQEPLETLHTNLNVSIALLKESLAETAAAAINTTASPRNSPLISAYKPSSAPARPPVQKLSYTRASGLEGTVVSRSTLGKHLMRYSCEEVVSLLQEMGLDSADVRPLKKVSLTGAELLLLDEEQLMDLLRLPKHKARRLKRLQDAMKLFDAIASRVAQSRLTDIELRLWLASQGCSSSEASRVMKLLRSPVMSDENAPFITAWEWVIGWTWVMHALEVYGVDWRV